MVWLYGDTFVPSDKKPYFLFSQYLIEKVVLINSQGFKVVARGRKGVRELNCRWDQQDRHFRATEKEVRALMHSPEDENALLEDELSLPTAEKEKFEYKT